MDGTLITPSLTSLYRQTEIDVLSLHSLTENHSDDIDLDMVRRMYHAKVQEAELHKLRPDTFIASDGTVFSHTEWKPLTGGEATQLYWNVSRINVGHLLTLCAR